MMDQSNSVMNRSLLGKRDKSPAVIVVVYLTLVGALAFAAGLAWSQHANAADGPKRDPRVVYPKKTDLDFTGMAIEGEMRNPGEFYFQHREEQKFDSLVKRRPNFHHEMLRDAVLSK